MSVPFRRAAIALLTIWITLFARISLAATPTPQIPDRKSVV